jgi:hypothetical protein
MLGGHFFLHILYRVLAVMKASGRHVLLFGFPLNMPLSDKGVVRGGFPCRVRCEVCSASSPKLNVIQ